MDSGKVHPILSNSPRTNGSRRAQYFGSKSFFGLKSSWSHQIWCRIITVVLAHLLLFSERCCVFPHRSWRRNRDGGSRSSCPQQGIGFQCYQKWPRIHQERSLTCACLVVVQELVRICYRSPDDSITYSERVPPKGPDSDERETMRLDIEICCHSGICKDWRKTL